MHKWTRGWALAALLFFSGCSSPADKATPASKRPASDSESGSLYSERLSSLEGEMASLGGERAWAARYLAGGSMVNAWTEGSDLFVEAFNADSRNFEIHCIDITDGTPKRTNSCVLAPTSGRLLSTAIPKLSERGTAWTYGYSSSNAWRARIHRSFTSRITAMSGSSSRRKSRTRS